MAALLSIAYISLAEAGLTMDEVADIAARSVRDNRRDGITGMMVFHDGQFMQVIEGPEDKVKALMVRIRRDPRHHSLFELFRLPIPAREFPDWSMALCHSTELTVENRAALDRFLRDLRTPVPGLDNAGLGASLLEQFRRDMLERKPC